MASRRPPLFELLQHQDGPRQGSGTGLGRPSALGHADSEAEAANASNGHAQGSVETKPSKPQTNGSATSTLEDLSEPTTKPEPKQPQGRPKPKRVPAPLPEPAATPKPAAKKTEPKPDRTGAADWSGMHPQSTVGVRMIWIYGAIVGVLAIVVGVWAMGYKLGVSSEKAQLERYLNRTGQTGTITDPMTTGSSEETAEPESPLPIDRQAEATQPDADPTPPLVEPEPVPTVDVLVDVRKPDHNYMKWASGMARDRAVGLAEHLTANGVHAIAIDEGRRGFGLYTALAVPSGQFSAMESQRRDLEARAVRILESAPQEAGGPYLPRGQLWMRFDG